MQCESTRSHWYLEPVVVVRATSRGGQDAEQQLTTSKHGWRSDASWEPGVLFLQAYECGQTPGTHQVTFEDVPPLRRKVVLEMSLSSRKAFRPTLAAMCGLSRPKGNSSLQCQVWAVKSGSRPVLENGTTLVMLRMPWTASSLWAQLCWYIGSYQWLRHVLAVCSYYLWLCCGFYMSLACLLVVLFLGWQLIDLCMHLYRLRSK